jgi:tight adherence protein C
MIATALGFAAAALAIPGLVLLIPERSGVSLRGVLRALARRRERRTQRAGVGAAALRLLAAAGRRVSPVARAAAPEDLEKRIAAAGLTGPARGPLAGLGARELMAAKLAATTLSGTLGATFGAAAPGRLGVALAVAAPVAGFLAPDAWLVRRAKTRARTVRRELPGMLDLLRVTVEAGLPLSAALMAVGERTSGALGAEWRVVGREVALGLPLSESLQAMLRRVPLPEVGALIGALDRTIRHGAPLAETLAAQARDARESRRRRIREEAARAGPKIQLVVALLLVPSVLLLVAAALAAALIDGRGNLVVG